MVFPVRAKAQISGELTFLATVTETCQQRGYDVWAIVTDEGAAGLRRVTGTVPCDGLLVMVVKAKD